MKVTALIPTYNASKSILRAIESALSQVDEIIVFDDGSSDDTVAKIKALNNDKILVHGLESNRGVWNARIQCLELCRTPLAAWLDSDDEFLPGRIAILRSAIIEQGCGWVYDNMEFYDGASLQKVGRTHYPQELNEGDNILFQFARNFIRGACQALIDVDAAKEIGYNALTNDSDYDHMLRAILYSDKRVYFHSSMTYRYYITAGSISSYKERQIESTNWILNNIGYDLLKSRLSKSLLVESDQLKISLYFLANIHAWDDILKLLKGREKNIDNNKWLSYFMAGVAFYKLGKLEQSKDQFTAANEISRKPECLNNLAVVEASLSNPYKHLLVSALNAFPSYLDAKKNLVEPVAITIVPLRVDAELPWNNPELEKNYSVL